MILRRYFKKIESEENSFQVQRHCKTEERAKKGQKLQNLHRRGYQNIACAWAENAISYCAPACGFMCCVHNMWAEFSVCLFFKLDRLKKPIFLLLTPN